MKMQNIQSKRIGIVGSGFVAEGIVSNFERFPSFEITSVLTRRDLTSCKDFPREDLLTNDLGHLIESSDLIIECSGDVLHATKVVKECLDAGLPVVTMDAEFHATTGSYFVGRGLLTEAEGDQPGSLAALKEEAELMGFSPLAYCNVKGFQNLNPSIEDMTYWSQKNGYSLQQTVSFTDGTKLQIEQTLVANGLGAHIAKEGMLGPIVSTLEEGTRILGELATDFGQPISDYVLSPQVPPGVFIVAEHGSELRNNLRAYKMGDGPYYAILRPYHLCHFEIPKTISRVLAGQGKLLDNSAVPNVSVAAIAKRVLTPGTTIKRGIGGFDVRGEAVRILDHADHVPIGLLVNARVRNRIEPGQVIKMNDVDLPDSLALDAWFEIRRRSLAAVVDLFSFERSRIKAPILK